MRRFYRVVAGILAVGIIGGMLVGWRGHAASPTTSVIKTAAPTHTYAALGDSVAGGLGLKTASDWRYCGQTDESYPHAVAKAVNMKLIDVSCRGAKTDAGVLETQDSNGATTQPQLTQLFKAAKPSLISLTIGANDIGWTDILQQCYVATCGSAADSAKTGAQIAMAAANLRTIFDTIKAHYPVQTPRLVVTGYYQVLPGVRNPDCFESSRIDQAETGWWHTQEETLNDSIKQVASEYGFITFAPVNFTGHELCTANPWIQDLQADAPIHPTAAGQAAIAKAVIEAAR